MYAIVEIAGQQFKVEKGRSIYTHRLAGDADAALASDQVKVLLVDSDGNIQIGVPTVEGASISAKIVEHLKGEKVLIFKKKRRKGYKKKNGHRQYLTKVLIEDILI
jgi:large subunit ribosomal protein L21